MIKGVLVAFHNKKQIINPGKFLDNFTAIKIFTIPKHRRVKTASILKNIFKDYRKKAKYGDIISMVSCELSDLTTPPFIQLPIMA